MATETALLNGRHGICGEWSVSLEEEGHSYTVRRAADDSLVDTTGLVSVTTFSESLFPYFDGPAVIRKMRPETRETKYAGLSDEEILKFWSRKGERAARLGTRMHSYIEEYFRNLMTGGSPEDLPRTPPPELDEPGSSGVVVMPRVFAKVAQSLSERQLVLIDVEKCVYDHELRMAGTIDAIFRQETTGDVWIIDWKRRPDYTISSPFEKGLRGTPAEQLDSCHASKALIQLNLYRGILKRAGICAGTKMAIITLHPNLPGGFHEYPVPVDEKLFEELADYRRHQLAK